MERVPGGNGRHAKCRLCGAESTRISAELGVCLSCIREQPAPSLRLTNGAHARMREANGLPVQPPDDGSVHCTVCANDCAIGYGEVGYCGLRENVGDLLIERQGIVRTRYVAAQEECLGASTCTGDGYTLAVFVYGCTFDCLSCPHPEHRNIGEVKRLGIPTLQQLAQQASCIRFYGGAPEPQLPFLLEATERILQTTATRICWELNGSAAPDLTRRAAHHAAATDGAVTVKIMARDASLHRALTGQSNRRTLAAFKMLSDDFDTDVLAAATPLVPGYVDAAEVEAIASFIASCSPDIPYILLPVQPGPATDNLPATSHEQAGTCQAVAAKYLNRVHIATPASAEVKNLL